MSFNNEVLKLMNLKLQLNNLNIQYDSFISQFQNGLIPNIGVPIEEISLKLINLGMEMLNIEMQSKNIIYFNSAQQIKNLGDMMKNIALQMTNMNSMKMPMQNMMMNNNFNNIGKYMTINFTKSGINCNLSFKYGTTIKEIIKKYCDNIGMQDNEHLFFCYNGQKVNKNDMTTIELYFINNTNPNIVVVDGKSVIG